MHTMHIDELDLNLLHVFRAVHEARNVSRAAERLGLSQPAASHALTRLRLALGDPLFVRAPGGVAPTPRAEQFAHQAAQALDLIDAALHAGDRFDPARSQRRFTLHLSDIGADEFLPQMMAAVTAQAPRVRLAAVQLEAQAIGAALDEGRLDLALGYLPTLVGCEHAPLLRERYVVLLRRGHPLARALADRSAVEQLQFILVRSHAEPARALHMLGLEPRIRLELPHFMVVPAIVAATDMAVILPLRPALRFARAHALQVVEPDLGLPPFTVSMHWHRRMRHDAGHRWLRAIVQAMHFAAPAAPGRRAARPRAASS